MGERYRPRRSEGRKEGFDGSGVRIWSGWDVEGGLTGQGVC